MSRRGWLTLAASACGTLLLALVWSVLLGWAQNLSAEPGNATGVRLLRGIVLGEATVLLVGVSLLPSPRTRPVVAPLLPWAVWLLILLTGAFCALGGFY